MKALKTISRIFAIVAFLFVLVAILVATGVVGSSVGFIDLSNVVSIVILGIAFIYSVVAAVTSLVYKLKIKSMVTDASEISVIINTEKKGRQWWEKF